MSSTNSFSVVSIGDLVADVIVQIEKFPVLPDQNQLVNNIQLEPGGAGNFLIAGSRLNMKMSALGALGNDFYGEKVLEMLEGEEIKCEDVIIQEEGSTTTVFVLVDRNGQHVFLGQYGIGPKIHIERKWKKTINDADAIMCWGYTLNEDRLAEALLESMDIGCNKGKLVFFDPGPYVKNIPPQIIEQALKNTRFLLLTEEELDMLPCFHGGLGNISQIFKLGPKQVCVKRGSQGCIIYEKDRIAEHHGYKVEVRDTTAAGDSFAAAYIYATLKNWTLADIAAFSNAMGAVKVAKFGSGRQVPDTLEIKKFLDTTVGKFILNSNNSFEIPQR